MPFPDELAPGLRVSAYDPGCDRLSAAPRAVEPHEISDGRSWPKLVFAPPAGERAANVHVRLAGSATARRNLLFRDFLRADARARTAWGQCKQRLARTATDLYDYGPIKQPATEVLMIAAEDWAQRSGWTDPSR